MAPKTLTERVVKLEAEAPLRERMIKTQLTRINNKIKVLEKSIEAYHEDVRNGMSDKIIDGIVRRLQEQKPRSKSRVKRFWENDNFWKLANRGMVISLFMVFVVLLLALGYDVTGSDSIILKILGKLIGG